MTSHILYHSVVLPAKVKRVQRAFPSSSLRLTPKALLTLLTHSLRVGHELLRASPVREPCSLIELPLEISKDEAKALAALARVAGLSSFLKWLLHVQHPKSCPSPIRGRSRVKASKMSLAMGGRAPPPLGHDHLRSAFLLLGRHFGISSRRLRQSLHFATVEHVAYWVRSLARCVDYAMAPAAVRAILDGEVWR